MDAARRAYAADINDGADAASPAAAWLADMMSVKYQAFISPRLDISRRRPMMELCSIINFLSAAPRRHASWETVEGLLDG